VEPENVAEESKAEAKE